MHAILLANNKPYKMNELALFAGAGGGILGGMLCGFRTVCAVEIEPACREILAARQNDGCLPPFPIWDDVRTFDGKPWRGVVDIVTGGFPCQDISCAGKGAGIDGERSGLWAEMARIVGEVLPQFVFVENSPMLVGRGLARVLADLAALGYDARWGVVGAYHAGAPHKRERIWILANANRNRHEAWTNSEWRRRTPIQPDADADGEENRIAGASAEFSGAESARLEGHRSNTRQPQVSEFGCDSLSVSDTHCGRFEQCHASERRLSEFDALRAANTAGCWCHTEPPICGVANGLAAKLDIHGAIAASYMGRLASGIPSRTARIKALGNGQVPAALVMAWNILHATQ